MVALEEIQDISNIVVTLIRIIRKLEAMQNIYPKPEFKQDYEYVDYALHVLGETIVTPFEVFPNFLEASPFAQVKSTAKSVDARNIGMKNIFNNQFIC